MIKLDRELFTNVCSDIYESLEVIQDLLDIISEYCKDDEDSEMNGYGCYGKNAKNEIFRKIKNKQSSGYFYLEEE